MKLFKFAVAAGAAVVAAGVLDASAQTVGPDFVKQRVEFMRSMFPSIQAFRKYASGEDTNAAVVVEQATRLASVAGDINKWFPPGTDRDSLAGSRTKPEVWSKKADFDAAVGKLVEESKKLASLSGAGNADAIKAQITVVTTACGGCHGGPAATGGTFRFEKPQ
ncbi:MAG: cytochrome c [Alphaproteobacteria bacterium]